MRSFSTIMSLYYIVTIAFAGRTNDHRKIDRRDIPQSPNKIIGVASIAGITNRNGRVSSLTGIKLIPGIDSPDLITRDTSPFLYPLTVTKEFGDKYASGTIQVYPGSVMVSSTAGSGYKPDWKWPKINMPLDDVFLPHLDVFDDPRSLDPWFPKDVFKAAPPPNFNVPASWMFPHFNPFLNLWR